MPRPFAVAGFSFVFVLGVLFSAPGWAFVFFAVISAVIFAAAVLLKRRSEPVILWSMAAVLAACLVYCAFMYGEYYPAAELAGRNMQIEARLTNDPQEKNGKYNYPLRLISVNGESVKAKLVLSVGSRIEAEAGDVLNFSGDIYVRGADNDDLEDYYRSTGIYLGANSSSEIKVVSPKRRSLLSYPAAFRGALRGGIMSALPGDRGGLIISMLFGDTSFLSSDVRRTFRNVGLSHLFSVSGLHISIWAVAVVELLKKLGLRGKASYWISMIFALLFMAVTGYSYSCVRAGIMIIIMLIGNILDAPYDSYNALGAAVLVSTLIRPFSASSVSLQLSVLSTLGIVFVSERMADFNRELVRGFRHRFVKRAVAFFTTTMELAVASVIFTLPVTSLCFGKVILVSPISNLFMITLSSTVMILGGIAGILSCVKVIGFLSVPLLFVLKGLSGISLKLINWLDGYKNLFIDASGRSFKLCLAGLMILMAFYMLLLRKVKIRLRAIAAACLIVIAVTAVTSRIINAGHTEITVMDVGNGSAVLVTKGERALMLGCGGDRGSEDEIINTLSLSCRNGLDVMIVPDKTDSESGASVPVVKNIAVKEIVAPEFSVNRDIVSEYSNLHLTERTEVTLWEGMRCEYFRDEDNCCAYLDAEGTTALIVFDPACRAEKLPSGWMTADILICRKRIPESLDPGSFKLLAVSSDTWNTGTYPGNFAVTAGTGSIVINSAGNSTFNFYKK